MSTFPWHHEEKILVLPGMGKGRPFGVVYTLGATAPMDQILIHLPGGETVGIDWLRHRVATGHAMRPLRWRRLPS